MTNLQNRPVLLMTLRIPTDGKAFKELKDTCNVKFDADSVVVKRSDLLQSVSGVHALLCHPSVVCDHELLEKAGSQLKVIVTCSVGTDHIDIAECARRNIKVANTPNVSTDTVAEATVGLTIAAARRFKYGIRGLSTGTAWDGLNKSIYDLCGRDIMGSDVGIVGLGRIGQAVAKRFMSLGVGRILYSGAQPKDDAAEVNAEFVTFDQLLEQSDFVVCCCSLKPENVKMFSSAAFKKMKQSAVFINTSRGAVVDQEALYDALTTGEIFSAGLDVTTPEPLPAEHPLLSLDNCLILPHMASHSFRVINNMTELCAKNILAGLRNEPLVTPVTL